MRKIFLSLLGFMFVASASLSSWADELALKPNHPDTYTVVEGDTLWDISNRFLNDPWRWPEIWHLNPEVSNPHLIYPGDVLGFITVTEESQTKRRLTVLNRGLASRTVKLTPNARVTPLDTAIPAIPMDAVAPFLTDHRIVAPGKLEKSSYIVSADEGRLIAGAGGKIYARGPFKKDDEYKTYGVYRKGNVYIDPITKELIGVEAKDIGMGKISAVSKDIATVNLSRTSQEVRIGDRLLVTEDKKVISTFFPSTPDEDLSGRMIAVMGGVSQIGQYDVVALNIGERDGAKIGNVFAAYKQGKVIKDRITNTKVRLPAERAGLLMVFRVFEKVSYGLVLKAKKPLTIMDEIRRP